MGIEVFLLETGEMVEQHTAVNLPNYLEEVLDREHKLVLWLQIMFPT